MKSSLYLGGVLVGVFGLQTASWLHAGTTIDATNRYAYAANLGWLDWVADTNTGGVIGEYVCSGYIYSANVGWINLGGGVPTNEIYYQNLSANDFGVNQDGLGNLRGYAWGANIGWVNFEATGAPKVDLATGKLGGYAYSANCGWISLTNTFAHVQADTIRQGTLAPNRLPIAWLLANFGTTNVDANADPTRKGMTIAQDYLAGTDPNNAASVLKITSITRGSPPNYTVLGWHSVLSRYYAVQACPSSSSGAWADAVSSQVPGWNYAAFYDDNRTNQFYRIRAYRPLTP